MLIRAAVLCAALPLLLLSGARHDAHALTQGLPFARPVPTHWLSIGPRRVTSPAVPALGLGQYDAVGRLGPIAVDPTDSQIIYVASAGELGHEGCGVWKTTNGGISWAPIADKLPTPTLAVAAIALDPSDHTRVFIVTADFGLFRSDDAGLNWVSVTSENLKVRRNTRDGDWTVLLIDPRDPQKMFLTTDDGVRRSGDGGANWSTVLPGRASALVMDPSSPNVLYAALTDDGVYKTMNGGDDWTAVLYNNRYKAPHGMLLALSHWQLTRDGHETVYVLTGSEATQGGVELWRSGDGAASWTSVFKCETQLSGGQWYDVDHCDTSIMGVDPFNPNIVYFGGPVLRVSLNGGANVQRVPGIGFEDRQPAAPHGDYHGLAIDPLNWSIVYAATDGGIYRSSNHGLTGTWTFIGEGIANAEIYDLSLALTLPVRIIAGTQDNGNILYQGSSVWSHIHPPTPPALQYCAGCGGDGGKVAIDPNDANAFYVMGQFQDSLQRSADAGASYQDFFNGLPAGRVCAAYNSSFDFQILPTNPSLQVASCISVYGRSLDTSWTSVFTPTAGSWIVRTARDASVNILYAGGSDGRVYAGLGNGALWRTIFTPAQQNARPVSDIEVDPAHPENIYVSFAPPFIVDRYCGGAQPRIYRLTRSDTNPQESTVIATDITGDLKSGLCVNALAVDPHQTLAIYAATSKGVYQGRPAAGVGTSWTWTDYNAGMPPADVRDLEVLPATRQIYAATYGRSAFRRNPDTLTVVHLGSGSGTIASNVGAIVCGATCSDTFASGTPITLTAVPARGHQFTGWLGPCTGVGTCDFTISGSTTVTATFAATPVGPKVFDFDGNTVYDPPTDGLLALRYLFGLSGGALIDGAVGGGATRLTDEAIGNYFTDINPMLDIDGNGDVDALTDGLLITRYMLGVRGASLLQGALAPDATRTNTPDIETYIQGLMP